MALYQQRAAPPPSRPAICLRYTQVFSASHFMKTYWLAPENSFNVVNNDIYIFYYSSNDCEALKKKLIRVRTEE